MDSWIAWTVLFVLVMGGFYRLIIKAIEECKGDVYLETKDGDVLNLKSKLCQMLGLSTILRNSEVAEATIRCTDPEDETMLFRFNLYGEMPKEQ